MSLEWWECAYCFHKEPADDQLTMALQIQRHYRQEHPVHFIEVRP